jgi:hypothetical protein
LGLSPPGVSGSDRRTGSSGKTSGITLSSPVKALRPVAHILRLPAAKPEQHQQD